MNDENPCVGLEKDVLGYVFDHRVATPNRISMGIGNYDDDAISRAIDGLVGRGVLERVPTSTTFSDQMLIPYQLKLPSIAEEVDHVFQRVRDTYRTLRDFLGI